MIIEPFVFKVSDDNIDQYNIVQKVLFENGYCWIGSDQKIIPFNHTHDCVSFCDGRLAFSYISNYKIVDDNIYYQIKYHNKYDKYNKLYFDNLTFKEFMSRYSLASQRRKKLERINNV